MIIGPCPYCGEMQFTPIAPNPPMVTKETCHNCGKTNWVFHSRLLPKRYSQEEFDQTYEVNEEKMTIRLREADE